MNIEVDKEYQLYKEQGRVWGQVPKERIKKIKFPRVEQHIIDEFLKINDLTTNVSDVLDSIGINAAVPSSYISPIITGKKIVGPAVTLRNIPERKTTTQGYFDKENIKMSTREVYYLAEEGDVLVADGGGNLDISNMGGQSCTVAKTRGLAGNIVNGVVRDASTIKNIDYPVWSYGSTPITGKFRIDTIEINGPVSLHNIVVYPGDLMVADDSGVCAIPYDKVEYVLQEIKSIDIEEEKMRKLIVEEAPIDELRSLFRKRY